MCTLFFGLYSYIVFLTMTYIQEKRSTAPFFYTPPLTNTRDMILCIFFSQDWGKNLLYNSLKKKKMQTQQNLEIDFWISKWWYKLKDSMPPAQILHRQKCCSVVITFCPYLGSQHLSLDQKIWEGDVSTFDFKRRTIKRSAGCCQMDLSKHRYSTQNTAVAPALCSTCPPPKFLAPCSCSQILTSALTLDTTYERPLSHR